MYTAYIKEIDNYSIVIGFGKLTIDPMQTANKKSIVYFDPNANETVISDSKRDELQLLISENPDSKITIDGKIVADNIGTVYYDGKGFVEIKKLGEAPKGKLLSKHTAEEIEEIRMSNLSTEDKTKEYENLKSSILAQSINKKSEAEILGESDPVKIGRAYYDSELNKLNKKYGVK